ncbi:MAG: aldose epimerase family protein [Oceanicoccus sp.]
MNPAPCLKIQEESFGKLPDGGNVVLYTLANSNGQTLKVTNYGGVIVALTAADRDGQYTDIVLGYQDLDHYQHDINYLGALVGRCAGRIDKGCFNLDGRDFKLNLNSGEHHLHGGVKGLDKKLWQASVNKGVDNVSIALTTSSADGEEGYPGLLDIKVVYTLTDNDELIIGYEATTTKTTIFNPTQHLYFNLSGDADKNVLDHLLHIRSTYYLPINSDSIPTGEVSPVAASPFDFRQSSPVGESINSDHDQIQHGSGYDHYWLLDKPVVKNSQIAAQVIEPNSGRRLSVLTDQPGLVFYSGNYLDGQYQNKDKLPYMFRTGFCLETQRPPDAPNHAHFPSTKLEPGEQFSSTTVFVFDSI